MYEDRSKWRNDFRIMDLDGTYIHSPHWYTWEDALSGAYQFIRNKDKHICVIVRDDS